MSQNVDRGRQPQSDAVENQKGRLDEARRGVVMAGGINKVDAKPTGAPASPTSDPQPVVERPATPTPNAVRAARQPAATPGHSDAWQTFVGAAGRDLDTAQPLLKSLRSCVVVLGGSRAGAGSLRPEAAALGRLLGEHHLPVRVPDRAGDMAAVVAAARAQDGELYVESVDRDTKQDLPADLRFDLRTHEVEKAILMHGKATAFVVLPGGVEALYELFSLWTLMDTGLAPARPIVLVGEFWRKFLPPLMEAGLALGTVSKTQCERVVFADDVADAADVLRESHAQFKDTREHGHQRFRSAAQIDLMRLPPTVDLFEESAVALGSARMQPGSEAYRSAQRFGDLSGGSVRTGGGPGIMEAVPAGAKARDPQAHTEGINITLPHEQAQNSFIDAEHAASSLSIEMRQRLLLERAASYAIFPGGTGTWFELFHLWQLMASDELPRRPILITGFYRDFLAGFLAAAETEGLLTDAARRVAREQMVVADSIEELAAHARAAFRKPGPV